MALGALLTCAPAVSRAATITPVGADGRSISWTCSTCSPTSDSRVPSSPFSSFHEMILAPVNAGADQTSSLGSNFIAAVGSVAGASGYAQVTSTMSLEFALDQAAASQIHLLIGYLQDYTLTDSFVTASLMRENQGVFTTIFDEEITGFTAHPDQNLKMFDSSGILDAGHYLLEITAQMTPYVANPDDVAAARFEFDLAVPEPTEAALLLLALPLLLRRLSTRRS